jgi:radical SAM superfamily enzyme YgiQ (UPF0313 family)
MKKIKILPVYPYSPFSFWSFGESLKLTGKKATMPPTGLLTAMAMFPQDKFEFLPLQDLNVQPLDEEAVKSADLIATSSMVIHSESQDEIVNIAHKHNKKVVSGGPYPTATPERCANVDYIVGGEGELTIPLFIEDFLGGHLKHLYTEAEAVKSYKGRLSKINKPLLSATPIPRWDLVPDLNVYSSAGIQYSRGCPHDCEFCDITARFGRESRTKGSDQMIEEIDTVYNLGFRGSIFVVDDNFIGNLRNLKQFLPSFIDWQKQRGYPYEWYTEASVKLAHPENRKVLEQLVEAGMDMVFLGIETVDPDMIKVMNKSQNLRQNPRETVKILQNAGLEVTSGFIIGTDGEKKSVFDNLYNFIQETGIMVSMVGLLNAAPGTLLYSRLVNEERLRGESEGSNTHAFELNFKPKLEPDFSEQELITGYKNLLQRLYNSKNFYERCKVHHKNLGKKTYTRPRANKEGLAILGRLIKYQLTGNWDTETMKYLLTSFVSPFRSFSGAVADAVKFQHFKQITRDSIAADAYAEKIECLYGRFIDKIQNLKDKYGEDFSRLNKVASRKADRFAQEAEKIYYNLHPDFRGKAERVLQGLKKQLSSRDYRSLVD